MAEAARTTAEREQRGQGQSRPGASAPALDEGALAIAEAPSLSAAPGDPGEGGTRQAAILRDPRLLGAGPAQRTRIVRQLQRSLGNSHVEQALFRLTPPGPAFERATFAEHAPDSRALAPEQSVAVEHRPAAAQPAASDEPATTSADRASSVQAAPASNVLDSCQDAGIARGTTGVASTESSPADRVQRNWFSDAVGSVAGAIADPKKLLLGKVADVARGLPGYTLLTQILGKDPISDKPVERSARGVFQAVLNMVPGGDQIFANLNESGAIDKAFAWLNEQWAKLGLTWDAVKGLFKRAWDTLSAGDLLNPLGAWAKLKAIFLEPLGRLRNFVVAIGDKVLEFIFEGVLEKLGGGQVLAVLKRVGDAFKNIIKDPIGFLGNLIRGVGEGLRNFAGNILRHLGKGLVSWLFGELASGGIELPKSFDLKGILTLVTSVLGLTWQTIRAQAVKRFGEPAVKKLESGAKGAFQLFSIIKEQGLGGVWELIKEQIGNLKDLVFDGIKDLVVVQVIQAGVQWLIGILGGPAGMIVKAITSIYNVVVWFIDNRERLVALFNGIVDSITAIAAGSVGQAAKYIEGTLASAIPMVLSFLARLLGLGNLSGKIRGIIEKVQAPVKKAVGWVLGKAKGWVKKLAAGGKKAWGKLKERLGFKKKPPEQRLKEGLRLGVLAVNKLKGKPLVGEAILRPLLQGIRVAKGLSLLEPFVKGKVWAVRGDVQRVKEIETTVPAVGELPPDFEVRINLHGVTERRLRVRQMPAMVRGRNIGQEGRLRRPDLQDRAIEFYAESEIGPSLPERARTERQVPQVGSIGLGAKTLGEEDSYESAHGFGRGFGKEFAFVAYAPKYFNQRLQNAGIEKHIRSAFRDLLPDVKLIIGVSVTTHPGTLRVASITYKVMTKAPGQAKPSRHAEIAITVSGDIKKPTYGFSADLMGEYAVAVQQNVVPLLESAFSSIPEEQDVES